MKHFLLQSLHASSIKSALLLALLTQVWQMSSVSIIIIMQAYINLFKPKLETFIKIIIVHPPFSKFTLFFFLEFGCFIIIDLIKA